MRLMLVLLLAAQTLSCVNKYSLTGPDGSDVVGLQCPSDIYCLQAAGDHCGKRGYKIIAASPHFHKACQADPKVYGLVNAGTGFRSTSTLVVQCGPKLPPEKKPAR